MRGILLGSLALAIHHVSAHPLSQSSQGLARRVVDLNAFRLKALSDYVNATTVDEEIVASFQKAAPKDTATDLVKTTVPGAQFRLVESYTGDNGVAHFYFRQTANGLDIDNADFNVNVCQPHTHDNFISDFTQIGRDGSVFSYGNSFYEGDVPAPSDLSKRDQVDPADALKGAVNALQLPVTAEKAKAQPKAGKEVFAIKNTKGAVKEPEARLVYLQTAEKKLVLTWRVETDILDNWLLSYVDAKNGEDVHAVVEDRKSVV